MEELKRVAIHSVPRSGSTWLGSIFDSHPQVVYKLQPLFSYALKGRLTLDSNSEEIDHFFDDLIKSKDDFMDQVDGKSRGIIPVFDKVEAKYVVYKEVRYHHILKNLLKNDHEIKVIGIIRNPLSVVDSWLKAPKEFRSDLGWRVEEEWRYAPKKNLTKPEEFNGYEKWKEVAILFSELKALHPERFYLLDYSDLIANPQDEVKLLFDFCGLGMTDSTTKFVQTSTSRSVSDAYGVYRNNQVDDKWKDSLPDEIVSFVKNDLENTPLKKYLS